MSATPTLPTLLSQADIAMYAAKRGGKAGRCSTEAGLNGSGFPQAMVMINKRAIATGNYPALAIQKCDR
jgi:hypothetical protein